MTGDSEKTAKAIAKQAGVDRYKAEVLPEDKAAFVSRCKAEGKTVVMIGDGINDTPGTFKRRCGHCHKRRRKYCKGNFRRYYFRRGFVRTCCA